MYLYHIDHFGLLKPGDTIVPSCGSSHLPADNILLRHAARSLFPDGLSNYGLRTLLPLQTLDQLENQLTDWVFEYVRLSHFSSLPSRFTSLFASTSIEDAISWISRVEADACKLQLLVVDADIAYIADAHFLDLNTQSPMQSSDAPLPLAQVSTQASDRPSLFPAQVVASALRYWDSMLPLPSNQASHMQQDCNPAWSAFSKPEVLIPLPVRVFGVVPRSRWSYLLDQ